MKIPLLAVFLAVATGLAASAPAQDDKEALRRAMESFQAAPAARVNVTSSDLNTKQTDVVTLEIVRPDSMHMRKESGGQVQMELVTDGKKTYIRRGEGAKYELAPAAVSNVLGMARQMMGADALVKMANNVKLEGHGDVNGVPASIYTFDSEVMGLHGSGRIWISDTDHRPLKSEGKNHGELKAGAGPGRSVNRESVTTYDYDPSIKITLPPA